MTNKTQLAMDGCAVRAYITGLKADVLRAPDKFTLDALGDMLARAGQRVKMVVG